MNKIGERETSFEVLQTILAAYRSGSFKKLDDAIQDAIDLEHDILLMRRKNEHRISPLVVE